MLCCIVLQRSIRYLNNVVCIDMESAKFDEETILPVNETEQKDKEESSVEEDKTFARIGNANWSLYSQQYKNNIYSNKINLFNKTNLD